MKEAITHIVIQAGYCVFGAGASRQEAVEDAAKWMEDEYGRMGGMNANQVEDLIVARPNDGEFTVLSESHEDFGSYLKNQGGFSQIEGRWFAD